MVKIFIVRHGYSLGNEKGLITGHYDCDLAEYGFRQAQLISDYIVKNLKVDKVYSSDLCRAVNTIKPMADALNLPIIKEPAFREMAVGKWEAIAFKEAKRLYPKEFDDWMNTDDGGHAIGGESWSDVQIRAVKRLNEIVKENDGKNIVLCTHGGVIKVLQCYFAGLNIDKVGEIDWVSNTSITEVWYEKEKYSVKRVSFDDYLGEIKTALPKTV